MPPRRGGFNRKRPANYGPAASQTTNPTSQATPIQRDANQRSVASRDAGATSVTAQVPSTTVPPTGIQEAESAAGQPADLAAGAGDVDQLMLKSDNAIESEEELVIVNAIKNANNTGVTVRELGESLGMQTSKLNKILAHLERNQKIRSFKGRDNRTTKRYILFYIEPAPEITGGAWFDNGEFDQEAFTIAAKVILSTLGSRLDDAVNKHGPHPSNFEHYFETASLNAGELAEKLNTSQMFQARIRIEDVENLMLMYNLDGLFIKRSGRYCLSMPKNEARAYFGDTKNATMMANKLPCTDCPVERYCTPDGSGKYTPQECKILKAWMRSLTW